MPNIDVFAKVVAVEDTLVRVKSDELSQAPGSTFLVETVSGNVDGIKEHCIGKNVMLSGLRLSSYGQKLNPDEKIKCNYIQSVNSHISRCMTGVVSLKGIYYGSKSSGKDRITEVALWRQKAYKAQGDDYMKFKQLLDVRAMEISKANPKEKLPRFGYMIRVEKDGVLLEYTRACSSLNDISSNNKDYSPITSKIIDQHVSQTIKDAMTRHGAVQVSVCPFASYQVTRFTIGNTDKPMINPHARAINSLATKAVTRIPNTKKDRFGGHLVSAVNAAVELSNDYKDKNTGELIRNHVANKLGVSGKQVLTALIAPSPYTGKALDLGNGLEDALVKTTDKGLSTNRIEEANESVSGSAETSEKNFKNEIDEARKQRFHFVEAALTRDGEIVALFNHPDGAEQIFTREEVAMRIKLYNSHGLSVEEYRLAYQYINELDKHINSEKTSQKEQINEPMLGN